MMATYLLAPSYTSSFWPTHWHLVIHMMINYLLAPRYGYDDDLPIGTLSCQKPKNFSINFDWKLVRSFYFIFWRNSFRQFWLEHKNNNNKEEAILTHERIVFFQQRLQIYDFFTREEVNKLETKKVRNKSKSSHLGRCLSPILIRLMIEEYYTDKKLRTTYTES